EAPLHVAAAGVLHSQHNLTSPVTADCRSAKPMHGLSHVLWHPLPPLVSHAEIVLPLRTAGVCSLLIPAYRLDMIARVLAQVAYEHLRECIAPIRRLDEPSKRLGAIGGNAMTVQICKPKGRLCQRDALSRR